jgi:uncharacterized membrane protein
MPFCTQCGTQVAGTDAYCANCGAQQPEAARIRTDFVGSMRPNTASLLCYIPFVGWIAAIVVLASQRFRQERDVRFHAFQGLYLFVAWLILDWGVGPFFAFVPRNVFHFSIAGMLKMVVMAAWIFMIVKASQGERYRLPVFGELAERSLTEQQL